MTHDLKFHVLSALITEVVSVLSVHLNPYLEDFNQVYWEIDNLKIQIETLKDDLMLSQQSLIKVHCTFNSGTVDTAQCGAGSCLSNGHDP